MPRQPILALGLLAGPGPRPARPRRRRQPADARRAGPRRDARPQRPARPRRARSRGAEAKPEHPGAAALAGHLDGHRLPRLLLRALASSPGGPCRRPCTSARSTWSTSCSTPSGPATRPSACSPSTASRWPGRGRPGPRPARRGPPRRPGDRRRDHPQGAGRGRGRRGSAPSARSAPPATRRWWRSGPRPPTWPSRSPARSCPRS